MVVSVETQKIQRRLSSGNKYRSPKLAVRPGAVPLYLIPFIMALFIYSISINTMDMLWEVNEPQFRMDLITLPEETVETNDETGTLKAEAPSIMPQNIEAGFTPKGIHFSEYLVREGDRYSIIASKYGITLDTLISVNKLTGTPVKEGITLKIPSESGIAYTIQKGDTLSSISRKYHIPIDIIRERNELISTVIHIDEILFLPGAALTADERERILGSRFTVPAEGTVKDNYGSYIDPVTGLKNYNYGIDIVNRKGTAVYAARSGVVGNTSYNSYYGRVIQLNHSGSMQSIYSCLDSIVVKPGEEVERGELLGYMGSSGFKTGEHLQFSIFKNKEDVDTLDFIF